MNSTLARDDRGFGDAALAAIAEHIEASAWQDIVAAAPKWLRDLTGVSVALKHGMLDAGEQGSRPRAFQPRDRPRGTCPGD